MSATGDVTILDAARRRRYVLVRAVPAESISRPPPAPTSSDAVDEARAPSHEARVDEEISASATSAPAGSAVVDRPAEASTHGVADSKEELASATSDEPPDAPTAASPEQPVVPPGAAAALALEARASLTPPAASRPAASELRVSTPPRASVPTTPPQAAVQPPPPTTVEPPPSAAQPAPREQAPEARTPQPLDERKPEAAASDDAASDARVEAASSAEPSSAERDLPRAKQTLAYSAQRAEAFKREFETSRSLLAPGTAAPSSEAPASPQESSQAQASEPRGLGPASSIPPAPRLPSDKPIRPLSDSARPRVSMPSAPRLEGLVPMGGRDVDPSPQSPLTYRERAFSVARSTDRDRLEGLLQAQFLALRRELTGKPRGQLIHLAVFDHSFDDRPVRPPIATLEWRDWRGNAVFVMAGENDVAEAPPAARAPESSWPLPIRAQVGASTPSRTSWPAVSPALAREVTRPSSAPAAAGHDAAPARPGVTGSAPAPAMNGASSPELRAGTPAPVPAAAVHDATAAASRAEAEVWPEPSRAVSTPPAASNWPVPAQTPLEPARVLPTSWPVAPAAPEPAQVPLHDPFPRAADVIASASSVPPAAEAPTATVSSWPNDPFAPAPPTRASEPAPSQLKSAPPESNKPPAATDPFGPARPFTDPFAPAVPFVSPELVAPATSAPVTAPARDPAPAAAAFVPEPVVAPVKPTPIVSPFDTVEPREATGENDSRLATAFEAMPDLYFLPTPVAGLEFTLQLISRLAPCEAVSGCLYDINMDVFRFVVLTGPGAVERRAGSVPSQAGLFGVAKRDSREALVVADVSKEARYDARIDGRDGLEARSLAYLPLRHGGQLLGMMQLINRTHERGFTASDIAVLGYVTTQLAEFIASRRMG